MRRLLLVLLGLAMLPAAVGCRNSDVVEAELRTRENQLYELRDQLHRQEAYNEALQRELQEVRQNSAAKMSPEQAARIYTVRGIRLGRLTGGYDDDNIPGDEALQVVLEPYDPDGHTIKAPGSVHVLAFDITPEGLKTPLSSWDLAPQELRRQWRDSFLGVAYYLVLPWKIWPHSPRLRVVAQFTLADGRVFEADRDVTIHLKPGAGRLEPPAVPAGETPPPDLLEPESPLPSPRPVEPAPSVDPMNSSLKPGNSPKAIEPASAWHPLRDATQLLRPTPAQPVP